MAMRPRSGIPERGPLQNGHLTARERIGKGFSQRRALRQLLAVVPLEGWRSWRDFRSVDDTDDGGLAEVKHLYQRNLAVELLSINFPARNGLHRLPMAVKPR